MLQARGLPFSGGAQQRIFEGRRRQLAARNKSRESGRRPAAQRLVLSCSREGAKGPRIYDWARVRLFWSQDPQWEHWLLIRAAEKPGRAGILHLLCTGRNGAGRTGRRRGPALDNRDLLRDSQGRTRPRSLRGTIVARLAPSHKPRHDRACFSRQIARRSLAGHSDGCLSRQTERKESETGRPRFLNRSPQLGVTIYAIRHLLARAIFLSQTTRKLLFQWADWRIRHNEIARSAHYRIRQKMQL
jgi:hypothetical protein